VIMVYLLFIVGFFLLIKGAEWLVDGASMLARKIGISELVVGLTVVAFGTSLPELVVNLFAGGQSGALAIGNVLGSNIANTLLILGVAAIIHPLSIRRTTVYREIVFNVLAAGMLGVLVSEKLMSAGGFNGLDRIDGVVLISYFLIFIYYTFGRKFFFHAEGDAEEEVIEFDHQHHKFNLRSSLFKIGVGSAGLYLGGRWIVEGAIELAMMIGVSDALIGLTIVAVGTSLPELAATVIAVRKARVDIAVGNIVGSNLFNIFWVLGLSAIFNPLDFSDELFADVLINLLVALFLFGTMIYGKYRHQISKSEGYTFVALYVAYLAFAIIQG